MRQSRLMHSNNSGLTQYSRTILILWWRWWEVGWVVMWGQWTGAGVTWSQYMPWSIMGQHRRQCLSVVIIPCHPECKDVNDIMTWHDINIYPVAPSSPCQVNFSHLGLSGPGEWIMLVKIKQINRVLFTLFTPNILARPDKVFSHCKWQQRHN